MNTKKKAMGIVYSTNPDFTYNYGESAGEEVIPPARQQLRIWLEKNHRGGKVVTLIKGFAGPAEDLEKLGKSLKTHCGTGGSVKDQEILLQGDQREKTLQFLLKAGYNAKKAGA